MKKNIQLSIHKQKYITFYLTVSFMYIEDHIPRSSVYMNDTVKNDNVKHLIFHTCNHQFDIQISY